MKEKINYKELKDSFPKAFEMLNVWGKVLLLDIELKISESGSINFWSEEGFVSENFRWNDRMLFDFFDEFQISVEIQSSFDSKIRFTFDVSYLNESLDKIIFKTGELWIHRESAEKEAFEAAFKCLNILLEKGKFTDLVISKINF